MTAFLLACVTTLAGLIVVALWRGGGRLLAALVAIGRLPNAVDDLVTEIRNAIRGLDALASRVERLEAYLPDTLHVTANLDLSNQTEGAPS